MSNGTATNPRYLAILAAVSALILIVGALFRPARTAEEPSSPPVPESELARLTDMAERRSLDAQVEFFASVGRGLDATVLRVGDPGASAIAWDADLLLTARPSGPAPMAVTVRAPGGDQRGDLVAVAPGVPFALVRRPAGVRTTPAARAETVPTAGQHVVAVWRDAAERRFAPGHFVAVRTRACDGLPAIDEALTTVPLVRPMIGGGLFDLDGRLLAVVLECAGQPAALAVGGLAPAIVTALQESEAPARLVLARYGVTVRSLTAQDIALFRRGDGLLVQTAWDGYALAEQLAPGDILAEVDGLPVTDVKDLLADRGSADGRPRTLSLIRGARTLTIPLTSGPVTHPAEIPFSVAGLVLGDRPGQVVRGVTPGSALAEAGLVAGDRILAIDRAAPRDERDVVRMLSAKRSRPLLLEIGREGRREAVVLQPRIR